jgi:hypothetical protein
MKAVRLGFFLLALLAFGLPRPASAQAEDDAARARQLFSEGVELAGQHQYAEAAQHFRQALALRDAPAIRYNLASTLFEEHQYTEAHEIAAGLLAQTDLPDSVRTATQALELQIGAGAAFVTFDMPEGLTGDFVVDGTPVTDVTRGTAVTPGRHTVIAVDEGRTVAEASFEIGSGVRRDITLARSTGEHHAEQTPAGPEGPITDQWWFWTAIGGGVVVLGVIIGVAIGVTDHNAHAPISGNFSPGILSW